MPDLAIYAARSLRRLLTGFNSAMDPGRDIGRAKSPPSARISRSGPRPWGEKRRQLSSTRHTVRVYSTEIAAAYPTGSSESCAFFVQGMPRACGRLLAAERGVRNRMDLPLAWSSSRLPSRWTCRRGRAGRIRGRSRPRTDWKKSDGARCETGGGTKPPPQRRPS